MQKYHDGAVVVTATAAHEIQRICDGKQKPTITKCMQKLAKMYRIILDFAAFSDVCRFKIETNYYSNNALFPYLI